MAQYANYKVRIAYKVHLTRLVMEGFYIRSSRGEIVKRGLTLVRLWIVLFRKFYVRRIGR